MPSKRMRIWYAQMVWRAELISVPNKTGAVLNIQRLIVLNIQDNNFVCELTSKILVLWELRQERC